MRLTQPEVAAAVVAAQSIVVPFRTGPVDLTAESADLQTLIREESGNDAHAVNMDDINAEQGDPSEGLCQVIGPTFHRFAVPGYDKDIRDPVSNIAAAILYIQHRYGSVATTPGILSMKSGGPYKGY